MAKDLQFVCNTLFTSINTPFPRLQQPAEMSYFTVSIVLKIYFIINYMSLFSIEQPIVWYYWLLFLSESLSLAIVAPILREQLILIWGGWGDSAILVKCK